MFFFSHAQAQVVSHELATISVNSPARCNVAESHETLEREKKKKHVSKIERFLSNSRHSTDTHWDYIKTNFQLPLAKTRTKHLRKNKTKKQHNTNTAQHSTTAIG